MRVSKAIRGSQGILWRCSDSSKINNDNNNNNNNNNNILNKNDLMLFCLGATMLSMLRKKNMNLMINTDRYCLT